MQVPATEYVPPPTPPAQQHHHYSQYNTASNPNLSGSATPQQQPFTHPMMDSTMDNNGSSTTTVVGDAATAKLKREIELKSLKVQELGRRISANNKGYLTKEAELTQNIREATSLYDLQAHGADQLPEIAGVQNQVARANKALDEAEASQKTQRIADIRDEIKGVKKKIDKRELEERLAATALQRLNGHIVSLEKGSDAQLSKLNDTMQEVSAVNELCYDNRVELAKIVNIPLQPFPEVSTRNTATLVEKELAPKNVDLFEGSHQLAHLLSNLVKGLVEEGELRSAVYSHLETANQEIKQQLEGQSGVLLDAQKAMQQLHTEIEELKTKVQLAEDANGEVHLKLMEQGSLKAIREQKLKLEEELAVAQREEAEAHRLQDETELTANIATKDRKSVLMQLSEAESAASRAKDLLDETAAKRSDLETERATLQRTHRNASTEAGELDVKISRARSLMKEKEEEVDRLRARQKQLTIEMKTTNESLREAQREAESETKLLAAKQKQRNSLEKDKATYIKNIEEVREKLNDATKSIEIEKASVDVLTQTIEDAMEELNYTKSLLPPNHPSVVGSSVTTHGVGDDGSRMASGHASGTATPRDVAIRNSTANTANNCDHSMNASTDGHHNDRVVAATSPDAAHPSSASSEQQQGAIQTEIRHLMQHPSPSAGNDEPNPQEGVATDFQQEHPATQPSGALPPLPHRQHLNNNGSTTSSSDPYFNNLYNKMGGDAAAGVSGGGASEARSSASPQPHHHPDDTMSKEEQRATAKHGSQEGNRSMAEINSRLSAIMSRRSSQRTSLAGSSVAPFQPPPLSSGGGGGSLSVPSYH